MTTMKLCPFAPSEVNTDNARKLDKKVNDTNSSNNSVNSKEMITYFKEENNASLQEYKNYIILSSILIQ